MPTYPLHRRREREKGKNGKKGGKKEKSEEDAHLPATQEEGKGKKGK